jgi:hypothetical protein
MALAALGVGTAAVLLLRWRRRWSLRARLSDRLGSLMRELGATEVEPDVWEFEGRRYQLDVEAPGLFGGPLSLTAAMFTDRVYEFYVRRAGGVPTRFLPEDDFYRDYSIEGRLSPALRQYLLSVKEILRRAMPGRWKTFGKGYAIIYFSDNEFDSSRLEASELKLALRALKHLDQPIDDPVRGGAFTFRSGFEADCPPWHWSPEAIQRLPANVSRAVVSYYHDNAYLNEGLVDFFAELAGRSPGYFLTDQDSLGFLRQAFGAAVRIENGVVQSERRDVPVAADQYLDGGFFAAFVAAEKLPESLRGLKRFEIHEAALRELPNIKFYVRRLLDDEASWFSGEYEILSLHLTPEELGATLEKLALKYDAKIMPLERRFTLKVFRDEKFEYST